MGAPPLPRYPADELSRDAPDRADRPLGDDALASSFGVPTPREDADFEPTIVRGRE